MHRDIKIGLILGLVLVVAVVIRIATDPRLSPEARIEQLNETAPQGSFISENDILNESLPAFEQENLSYEEPAENIITSQETETIVPDTVQPAAEYAVNSDITAIEQVQTAVPDSSKYELAEKIQTQKFHIVQKNETLTGISQKYYGSANKWRKIFDFNRNVIEDPNKIRAGIKLIIPNL
jgi:nucleoid-associated protein YgaU